jgi:hypothetical protein
MQVVEELEEIVNDVDIKDLLCDYVLHQKSLDPFKQSSINIAINLEEDGHDGRRRELCKVSPERNRNGQ